jgi:hypothetical protein
MQKEKINLTPKLHYSKRLREIPHLSGYRHRRPPGWKNGVGKMVSGLFVAVS